MRNALFALSFLVISTQVYSEPNPQADTEFGPWFTGPLLTPSSQVIPGGYINVEPYLFVNVITGRYSSHWHPKKTPHFYNINFQLPIQIGITKWMDFAITPEFSINRTKGKSSTVLNDLISTLDFQLYKDDSNTYPDVKFTIQETFPTGRYQKLGAHKHGTDAGGGGCFVTSIGFVFDQTYHIFGKHYLEWRFNPFYSFSTPVHVRGINTYGGAHNTRGTIRPGQSWSGLFGLEYSLTQNWALAFDLFGFYQNKIRFSGKRGTHSNGTHALVGNPSSVQFSFAPAIEYNFSERLGLIAGSWFSFAGRNSKRFASAVIALNYFGPLSKNISMHHVQTGGAGKH